MKLAALLTAAVVTLASALPAAAERLSLNQISGYLNQLQSAQGAFTQINGDGTISTGTIYIKRPGRVRFEYDPPEQALVMANSGQVVILDRKLGGAPESYPLSQTPLSIILARNVNLGQANMVKSQSYDGTATTVTAQDPRRAGIRLDRDEVHRQPGGTSAMGDQRFRRHEDHGRAGRPEPHGGEQRAVRRAQRVGEVQPLTPLTAR